MAELPHGDLAPGEEFAGYRIEALLGRGGMGVVYRAYDLRLERCVALKVIAPWLLGDEHARVRFFGESRAAAHVAHPHIVPLYAAGEHEGYPYIVTQLIEGMDLAVLLQAQGPLAPDRAVAIVTQIGSALDAAHAAGLVHRDVKPSNVLVSEATPGTEHVYLTDFGLAKRQSVTTDLTSSDAFVGTFAYVAPEQIENKAEPRSDLYSLGIVLYECLAGTVPFPQSLPEAVIYNHLQTEPRPPSELRPDLPAALDAVILKALEKEPEARYQRCAEFCAAARRALPADPSLLRVAHDGDVRGVAFSPDDRLLATASDDCTARVTEIASGRLLRVVGHARRVRGSAPGRQRATCGLLAVAFDPAGGRIATGGRDWTARIWSVDGDDELLVVIHRSWVRAVAFGPDGRTLATASDDKTARLSSIPERDEVLRITDPKKLMDVALSADGGQLATAGTGRVAQVWDITNDSKLGQITHDDTVWAVAFSPVGGLLATGSEDRWVVVWDLDAQREVRRVYHEMAIRAVAFSPDGRRVAAAGDATWAVVSDVADGRELARVSHDGVIWALAFSGDGKYLASGSADGTARVWAV